jgi:hypothetical protein
MGIEPTTSAWKAEVLPLNYTRKKRQNMSTKNKNKKQVLPVKIIPNDRSRTYTVEGTRF